METLTSNKQELTKAITLLLHDFEVKNNIEVDYISLKKKSILDKDGNVREIREVKTYFTQEV